MCENVGPLVMVLCLVVPYVLISMPFCVLSVSSVFFPFHLVHVCLPLSAGVLSPLCFPSLSHLPSSLLFLRTCSSSPPSVPVHIRLMACLTRTRCGQLPPHSSSAPLGQAQNYKSGLSSSEKVMEEQQPLPTTAYTG